VAEDDILRLMLPVPEAYVGTVHDGEPVTVTVTALGRAFQGKVTRFADRVQASTRTMTAEVDLKNAKLNLIPGMYAQVQLSLADVPNAIAIPIGALDSTGSANKVYTVDAAGVVHVRTITTGIQSPQFIQVMSGIEPGETVILGSHSGLQDGSRVQPHFE
jgi:RND family efflux transporter MFP subunit